MLGGKIIQSKSKRFLCYCFSFLIGISIVSLSEIKIPFIYLYSSFFLFIVLLFLVKNKTAGFIILCVLCIDFGIARHIIAIPETEVMSGIKQFTAIILSEPDVRIEQVNYIVKTKEYGNVYFKYDLYPRYVYGDELSVSCKLQKPEPQDDFRYDMYLARYGVFYTCNQPSIKKIGEGKGNIAFEYVLSFKSILADHVNTLWHEPHASFMAGLLYGYRGGLGSLQELFSITGVTHIVAISGYNISLIATILSKLFISLYIPRKRAFFCIVIGIALFVIFTGMSASVVRAGVMGCLVLLAKQLGRASRVANVMVLTAVLMVLQNPFILLWDAGFQLSFLSTLGLVYVSPIIEKWLIKMPEWFGMKETMIATLSATIATLPLILSQFGRLSIVSLPVNMLILWIIPWMMMVGFAAVVLSFIYLPVANIIAGIGWVGLSYIIVVVKWFAGVSFAAVDVKVAWYVMVGMYAAMIYLLARVNRQRI